MDMRCQLVIPASKPRNYVARDLLSPKYRQRVVANKKKYTRKEKHREALLES